MKERRKYFVSTSDSGYYPDETIKKYCVKCESYGFPYQPLSERIYQDTELINGQPPHDADKWLQCYRCGTITAVGHGKTEGKITGFIDVAGPGDSMEPMIEHFIKPRRRHVDINNKKNARQTALEDIENDPDVKRLTQGGSQLQGYTDTNT